MMQTMVNYPVHLIFCLRVKEKMEQVKNTRTGKDDIVSAGFVPITEKTFPHRLTIVGHFEPANPGEVRLTKWVEGVLPCFDFGNKRPIVTEAVGEKLRKWVMGGKVVNPRLRELKAQCQFSATNGTKALDDFLASLSEDDKQLAKQFDAETKRSLRATATDADNGKKFIDDEVDEFGE